MLDAHPYEEVAYDLIPLLNDAQNIGSGMIGEFDAAMKSEAFLAHVAQVFGCSAFKHTEILKDEVKKVAYCGGSGRFLLEKAKQAGADVFISSDFKYHEFFDHENKITILDIGHFETEQFTPELIARYLADKNVTFAVLLSRVNTNPVHYFIR
jgi:putative NIF3 family GTP cyclohydrolase 1 type 2